jgi:hypothetical protein
MSHHFPYQKPNHLQRSAGQRVADRHETVTVWSHGNCVYHHVEHSQTLHAPHTVHVCVSSDHDEQSEITCVAQHSPTGC